MVNIERLKKAHFAAAKIVEKLGENYLIFFERIHRELEIAEKQQDLQQFALSLASRLTY